uniref:Uncharacterized protein n=1 Tax=Pseudo-nitzschia australis TaxID=44445 RepID=A0A7S4AUW3_9STRA|mmetsp:Transcript_21304/g.46514  ORF Transcript_21304/g.46514 Transcript_21304/m.46514 type:complete len:280 (+) Transcript_21304:197-1036(+)
MKSCMATALPLVLLVSLTTQAARITAFVVPAIETPRATSTATATSTSGRVILVGDANPKKKGFLMSTSSSTGETEVERLLRMARELRAQAEESEKKVHEKLADKKADSEVRLGTLLNHLFYDGTKGNDVGKAGTVINEKCIVVERLRSKKPSIETLEKLVDWLGDRRDVALGYEHVEARGDAFVNVRGKKDEVEAERLGNLTFLLLDSLEVIDSENRKSDGHLGGGHNSADLKRRLSEKNRERDEQFLERQASFREAQSIKKGKSKYEFHDEFLDDYDN